MTIIDIQNVRKTYQMGQIQVNALAGISLNIQAGEFVAIMGPSGSGKSTLMHILGLLDRPDEGTYCFCGKAIAGSSDKDLAALRNRSMGFIFQQFHLLARVSALDNARLPLIYAAKKPAGDPARKAIVDVGLKNRAGHRPNELSGGQQQRVAIARALVNDPLVILADEPTGNLDSKSKEEIMAILKDLNQQGKTVIVVTHEKEVAAYCRRVIQVRDGLIISDESSSLPGTTQASTAVCAATQVSNVFFNPGKLADYFREAIFAVIAHKMRSMLSVLGVLIGIASVIAMVSIGQGAKISLDQQLASLGSNLLMVRHGSPMAQGVSLGAGAVTRFTFKDIDAIAKLNDQVKRVSPSVSGHGQLVYANKNWNTGIDGEGVDFAPMRASVPQVGRFFTQEEVLSRAKVVVLGPTVVTQLFGDADPIGETIKINLVNFKVIGILPSKGANAFHDQDDVVIMPVTTAMYRVLGKEYIDSIFVEAKSPEMVDPLQDSLNQVLVKTHRINPKDSQDAFQIRNMSDIKNALESTTRTMSLLLGGIAAISLLVGGIGIMNIMLVSVTERTREIGLRKAIGADNQDIMAQFLIEAIILSFAGGLLGVTLGIGAALLVSYIAGWAVSISTFSVVLGTLFSLVVGLVFGLWPAHQASLLNPIEALRYE